MQWAEIDGRQRLLVAGSINRFIPNPTFDPVAKPGSLDEYFRGRNPRGQDNRRACSATSSRSAPSTGNRDARLAVMDSQGIDGCFMFPTLAVAWRRRWGTTRGCGGRVPRLQPVARGRLGLRLP